MEELLTKYLLNEAEPEERTRVEIWLAESPANAREFAALRKVWELGRQGATPVRADSREALLRLRQRTRANRRVLPFSRRLAAAVITGIVIVGIAYWGGSGSRKVRPVAMENPAIGSKETTVVLKPGRADATADTDKRQPVHRAIWQQIEGIGQLTTDTLADGSVVLLQRHARLGWRVAGGDEETRLVRLSGEAFFEVARDASRPFVVETPTLRITVLGTSFRVAGGADSTLVAVKTGSVRVSNSVDSVVLNAAQQVVAGGGRTKLVVTVDKGGDHRKVMWLIIAECIDRKIIPDRKSLRWLALDSARFIINGQEMPGEMEKEFQARYLQPDGMGYYYGKVLVHGHGYFYEEKDIYPPPQPI